MDNSFGKIVSIIILSIAAFVVPAMHYRNKADSLEEMYINTKTIEFVDSVRNLGCITKEMYTEYERIIYGCRNQYEIELTHIVYGVNNGVIVKSKYFNQDILEPIFQSKYKLHKNDFFEVFVKRKNDKMLISYYGGCIKNEIF